MSNLQGLDSNGEAFQFHYPEGKDASYEATKATAATFVFTNEDHTLGNSLRHVLMQNKQTDFCGYSVPHPSEPKMNIRLQTHGEPAVKVLKQGLDDLTTICDSVKGALDEAVQAYENS